MNNPLPPKSPALERWYAAFQTNEFDAVSRLLAGHADLGPYNRAQPVEALQQLITREADILTTDQAVLAWLEYRLGKPKPDDTIAKLYATTLKETFNAIHLMPLPLSRAWAAKYHHDLRAWVQGFYMGQSRDPEAALLRALAQNQPDQALRNLWLNLSQLPNGTPWKYGVISLIGLRHLPADNQGTPERGIPKNLLRGLLNLGEAYARANPHDQKGKPWLQEVDLLAMTYPQSPQKWGSRLREVLNQRDVSKQVRNWLDTRYTNLDQAVKPSSHGKKILAPPHVDDFKPLLRQIEGNYQRVRPQLEQQIQHNRVYAEQSGDGFYLVRAFCNLAGRLLEKDAIWARELAHEALIWAPQNHHPWSMLARALEAEGDWRRAEAVFWQARRRFPHNVQAYSQLAHALLMHGSAAQSEAIYREAIRLFPHNPVCYADLAHSLNVRGETEQALYEYRQAQQHFSNNDVIANGLVDTLIDLGRLDEAQDAFAWAEQIAEPNDPTLQRIHHRLQRALNGDVLPPRQLKLSKEGTPGDLDALSDLTGQSIKHAASLGRAGLWRRQGGDQLVAAQNEINKLPNNSEKLIESGLLIQAEQNWSAAAGWFVQQTQQYPGDGVLRVHQLRAQARAEQSVDWSQEHQRYPHLLPVILSEEKGRLDLHLDENADLSTEQQQNLWLQNLLQENDANLRDLAQEQWLAARHHA